MTRAGSLALLVLVSVPACNRPAPSAEGQQAAKPAPAAPVAVQVAAVEKREMPRVLTLTGSIVAERHSEIAANVSGRVAMTAVERGQVVKAGQVLATVDSKTAGFSAAASSAQAMLADTQAAQAQQDCARADMLFAKGAIASAEYDRQKTQCKAQELQANAARAQAGLASSLVADSVIRAPFAGVIGERYVNVGEFVQPPSRVVSLYVTDPVRVTISVPEPAVGQVREGQMLELGVSSWPDRSFPATIVFLGPALRAATRDLVVEARASNADGALKPGMFATAKLDLGKEVVPTVPRDAVVEAGGAKRVFLVKDGKAFEVVVQTGAVQDGRIGVLGELPDGARVIRSPSSEVRDGVPVTEGAAPVGAAPSPAGSAAAAVR